MNPPMEDENSPRLLDKDKARRRYGESRQPAACPLSPALLIATFCCYSSGPAHILPLLSPTTCPPAGLHRGTSAVTALRNSFRNPADGNSKPRKRGGSSEPQVAGQCAPFYGVLRFFFFHRHSGRYSFPAKLETSVTA